nr:hypothetical protein [uncultured Acetobacter sp.]
MQAINKMALAAALVAGTVLAQPALAQTAAPAPAQGAPAARPNLTPEQMATLQRDMNTALHYKLASNVVPRLTSALKSIQAAHIQPPGRLGMSLEEQIGMVDKMPGLEPILKTNGFTAREFVMSLTCVGLTGSLMNVPPGQATGNIPTPDAQNVAILKANPQELQELITVLRAEHQSAQ